MRNQNILSIGSLITILIAIIVFFSSDRADRQTIANTLPRHESTLALHGESITRHDVSIAKHEENLVNIKYTLEKIDAKLERIEAYMRSRR